MKKLQIITLILLAIITTIDYTLIGKGDGGPPYNTKAPGEKSCSGAESPNSCHSGGAADNTGSGSVSIIFDNGSKTYIPGQTYIVKPRITHTSLNKFGFQIVSIRNSDNKNVGTITLIDTAKTRMQRPTWGSYQDRWYVMHKIAGTAAGSANTGEWTYSWKAPATNIGDITFYACYLAANSDGTNDKDDQTYYTKLVITPYKNVGLAPSTNNISAVSVYPNPVKDNINISFQLETAQYVDFAIVDLNGKTVYNTKQKFDSCNQNYNINNSNLSSGIYLLKLQGEGFSDVQKIIVE